MVGRLQNQGIVQDYYATPYDFGPSCCTDPTPLLLAHLKGCIDPTGKLPENRVFISGYVKSPGKGCLSEIFGNIHEKVFISRSPCLEPGDAKLVSVVGNKPSAMTSEEWNMLCSYSFGTIIFPQSRKFDPLPCVIAGEITKYFLITCNNVCIIRRHSPIFPHCSWNRW